METERSGRSDRFDGPEQVAAAVSLVLVDVVAVVGRRIPRRFLSDRDRFQGRWSNFVDRERIEFERVGDQNRTFVVVGSLLSGELVAEQIVAPETPPQFGPIDHRHSFGPACCAGGVPRRVSPFVQMSDDEGEYCDLSSGDRGGNLVGRRHAVAVAVNAMVSDSDDW